MTARQVYRKSCRDIIEEELNYRLISEEGPDHDKRFSSRGKDWRAG